MEGPQPNKYCDWTESDPLVAKARSLFTGTAGDTIDAIYRYVASSVSYDYEKADILRGGRGYVPSPERTYEEGKGVCFDSASLMCAMMRSVGVVCRLCIGYMDGQSHAWVEANDGTRWLRCDAVMASNGESMPTKNHKYETKHTF